MKRPDIEGIKAKSCCLDELELADYVLCLEAKLAATERALRDIEECSERLASSRTQEAYLAILKCPNASEDLLALDDARKNARIILKQIRGE